MTTYTIDYRFSLGDRVFYYDQQSGGFSRGTVRQVSMNAYAVGVSIVTRLSYTIYSSAGKSVKLNESTIFISTPPPTVPPPPTHSVVVPFSIGDNVWVANGIDNTISYVTIIQIDVEQYENVQKIFFLVQEENNVCSVDTNRKVLSDIVFATLNEALVYLGILETPPAPSGVVPTPTPTSNADEVIVSKQNSDSIALHAGMPVYIKGNGTIGRANSDSSALTFLGFVIGDTIPVNGTGLVIIEGVVTTTTGNWGAVVEGSPLASGVIYYLANLGTISSNSPSVGYSREVGVGISATELAIRQMPTYEL